jgi:alkylation response protein AidB-like acyl-CoA dehydrogenase
MNFDFSDDQKSIKSTARDFLASRFGSEKVRQLAESRAYDDALWREMCDLGWPGIAISEQYGGQGLGLVELVILTEEAGFALAPAPLLSNAAAALIVERAGTDEQRERWLPGMASGEELGTVAFLTDGTTRLVPDAREASVIVAVDGASARLIPAQDASLSDELTIDATRRFASLQVNGGEELDIDRDAARALVSVPLAGELVGIAQHAMEMAVAYAKDRKQFGHPIGAFQAVAHRCAQMLLEVEGARSTTYYAAWTADNEPESLALAAAMAKAYASDAGWRVAASSLQVHGGIGFTWEHDLHFFLKRARTGAQLFGSAREHRDRVADLIGV